VGDRNYAEKRGTMSRRREEEEEEEEKERL